MNAEKYTRVSANLKQYQPVWRCIYCGRDRSEVASLSKEHIIPLSLNGQWVLPRASCPDCAKKTGAFERTCGRQMLGAYRLATEFPTRHPADRPGTLAIDLHSGPGTERKQLDVPISDYPLRSVVLPEFELPGVLRGVPSSSDFTGLFVPRLLNLTSNNDLRRQWRQENKGYEITRTLPVTHFAQMLAKIAHSYAVAELGYGAFEPLLPKLILGNVDEGLNLPDFVGGTAPLDRNRPALLGQPGTLVQRHIWNYVCHENVTRLDDGSTYLTVRMQLVHALLPCYRVVVARL